MTIQTNFPVARPALLLDFANNKRLDPRITFTRTTTATYYDGYTTAKAEENLLVRSQDFSTIWSLERVTVTADSVAAPDGTTTADTITNTTATGAHVVYQSASTSGYSIVSGLPYTISVFAKKNTNNFLQITVYDASNTLGTGRANFDLQNGTAGTVDGGTSTITSAGNGWYRCSYTVTASASGNGTIYFGLITSSTAARFESYTGLGTESVYLWGAQVEQRSAVTAYTATRLTTYIPVLQTAAAGVARFDHNPITRESLGLLVEEARTNLLTYSADFSNAAWTKTRSSITNNTIIAPDGTLTGDKLVEDTTASDLHYAEQTISNPTNTNPYTFSVYAKAGERSSIYIRILEGSPFLRSSAVTFDLSAGTASSISNAGGAGSASASITSVGNGWYRCLLTTTLGGSATTTLAGLFISVSGQIAYTGNGYSGIYIWGAQLEVGAFATSYIPTVASSATRNADVAVMSGTNFTSWFNDTEGTIYVEAATSSFASTALWAIGNNTLSFGSGNMMYEAYSSAFSVSAVSVIYNGSSQVSGLNSGSALTLNTFSRGTFAYKTNDFAKSTNGATVSTDTSGVVPVGITGISIGNFTYGWVGASNFLNGTIRKIAYYRKRLTNAQLQALTT